MIRELLRQHRPPLLMGIINVTPDSFYDGGADQSAVIQRAREMVGAGAHLLDIGGESTRPGSEPVAWEEEVRRVVPVIIALADSVSVPLSIDTRRSTVAAAALKMGATIVNDVSALRDDSYMARLVAQTSADIILMHMQGTPRDMQQNPVYGDVLTEVREFLQQRVAAALETGIAPECITLDPGIGFGKRLEDNLALLARPEALRIDEYPLLMGASRKSFIERLEPGTPPAERLPGTLAAHLYAAAAGCEVLRVHDVAATRQALSVWRALGRQPKPPEADHE